GKDDLRGDERDPSFEHGLVRLLVNQRAMSGDVLRRSPLMHQDGSRGCNSDQNDNDCKELRHNALACGQFPAARILKQPPPDSCRGRGFKTLSRYLPLKVKSAVAAAPPATVTFAVCVPRSSCHAVTV